jgi:hypothetical protein
VGERLRLRRPRGAVALVACLSGGLALTGCGGGDGTPSAQEARDGKAALKRALTVTRAKRTAAFTIRLRSEGVPRGETGIDAHGRGRIDFPRRRSAYTMRYEEAPKVKPGTRIDLFSDRSVTFARPAGQGLYQRQAPSLVANGPADSLQYLGTDSVGVHATGTRRVAGRRCTRYAGRLDYARIRRRVAARRRAEFDRETHGVRSVAFSVCIDAGNVLREYVADIRVPGGGDFVLHARSRFTRVGSAARIAALRASQKA